MPKISEYPENAAPATTDAFPTAQAGTTRKTTIAQIFALAAVTAFNWTALQTNTGAAASTVVADSKVTADVASRWARTADGKMEWGNGTDARDTNLYRSAVDTLKTDDNMLVAGTFGGTGAATFGSTVGITGDLAVNTNKFTVAASSGNTQVAGTFGSTGAATLSSTLGVTGLSTLAGGLIATGAPATMSGRSIGSLHTITNTTGVWAGAEIVARMNPAGTMSGLMHGVYGSAEVTSANAQNFTAGPLGLAGVGGQAIHAGSGTVTGAASVYAKAIANTGGGTITNAYGLYLAAQTAGATNWGLYDLSSQSYHAGNVGIGMTPVRKLDVTGTFGATGAATLGSTLAVASTVDAGGTIRAYGSTAPASGAGVECHYTGANGYVQSYDRTGAAYMPLNLRGSTVNLAPSGTTVLAASAGAAAITGTLGVTGLSTLTGGAQIGTAVTTFSSSFAGARKDFTDTSGSRGALAGMISPAPGSASTASYYGASGNVNNSNANTAGASMLGLHGQAVSSTAVTTLAGGQFATALTGAVAVTDIKGIHVTASNSAAGTVTTQFGVYVDAPTNAGGATIDTYYGVRVRASATYGTSTWGVYVDAAKSYFGGGLDSAATIRATGAATPASGAGVEALYTGGVGYVTAYNRSGSVRLPMNVQGLTVTLNTTGGDALVADATTTALKAAGTTVATFTTSEMVLAKPARLMSYTLAALPAGSAGGTAYCTDHTGGARPVYSDGTNWRDFRTGNVAA